MFWLGVAVSLCYVPGVTGAYIATQWPLLAMLMPLALLRHGSLSVLHLFWLLFVAYASVHAVWGALDPGIAVWGLWLVTVMGLVLWFGTTLENVRGLYAGLALGAAVSSGAAVPQHFGLQWPLSMSVAPAGLYVNSIQQGTVLALLIVALCTERMWLWALPLLPGLALSQSRGAWIALVVGLTGCRVRRVWLLAGVLVAIGLYFSMPLSLSDRERMLIWQTATHHLTLFGWGPGSFYAILIQRNFGYLDAPVGSFFYPEHAHNDALQLVFEYGVGAVFPLAIFGFALSRTRARGWPIVLAFTTAGCYSFPLWMPIASFVGLVAVGRILREHALFFRLRDNRGQYVVPWRRGHESASGATVSMAPYYQTGS